MPFISEADIQKVQSSFASVQAKAAKIKEALQSPVARAVRVAEILGGAAGAAYFRAQLETRMAAQGKKYELFGMDPELLGGIGLMAIGFMSNPNKNTPIDKYGDDLINVGAGVMTLWMARQTGDFAKKKATENPPRWLGAGYAGHIGAGSHHMSEHDMARAIMHG